MVIGKAGRDISQADAKSHISGYSKSNLCSCPLDRDVHSLTQCPNLTHYSTRQALAVDMTARNIQDKVKKAGLPWSAAKGFDSFTPVGYVSLVFALFNATANLYINRPFIPKSDIPSPDSLRLKLQVRF